MSLQGTAIFVPMEQGVCQGPERMEDVAMAMPAVRVISTVYGPDNAQLSRILTARAVRTGIARGPMARMEFLAVTPAIRGISSAA